jgi:phospholipid/cholesterol/gamma-HCH transport system substrate-binding protein
LKAKWQEGKNMRSRMVREGSVGLLILLGLGLFVVLILWLRGITFGKRSYKAVIDFANAGGIQKGAVVQYRGIQVGKVTALRPGPNGVEAEIEISPTDVIIPRDVVVEANQSGLIGQVSIDITPKKPLPGGIAVAKPLDNDCDRNLIICNGSHLQGQIGVSLDDLIRSTTQLANAFNDRELFANVKAATRNTAVAAESISQLSRDFDRLAKTSQQQLGTFKQTAVKFGATADQLRLTAAQGGRLLTNLDSLLTTNRTALVTTLNNLSQTSEQLRFTVSSLTPKLNRLTQGKLIQNLETLSTNAAQASANLRDISSVLNKPTNRLVLQQTLDSARVTFQNAQKITSDLDELTGDPKVRGNLRKLINGLSGLVSSTQNLQQQVDVAVKLDSMKAAINTPKARRNIAAHQVIPINQALETSAAFSPAGKSLKSPVDSVTTQAPRSQESAQLAATLAEWQKKQR